MEANLILQTLLSLLHVLLKHRKQLVSLTTDYQREEREVVSPEGEVVQEDIAVEDTTILEVTKAGKTTTPRINQMTRRVK